VVIIVGITLTSVGAKVPAELAIGIVLIVVASVMSVGLTAVAPGEARVVQLLGRYTGTIRAQGIVNTGTLYQ
jgi:regulator of protease activity HflC (stomatin/prohibitin superfamily)